MGILFTPGSSYGKTFVFPTDNELGNEHKSGKSFADYVRFYKGANLLIHDGQYRPKEHSQFTKAIDLAIKVARTLSPRS